MGTGYYPELYAGESTEPLGKCRLAAVPRTVRSRDRTGLSMSP